jgi:hypothetical protein
MPVIPETGRLKQENPEFHTNLDYTAKPCLSQTVAGEVAQLTSGCLT